MENEDDLNQAESEDKFSLRQVIQVLKDIKSLTQSYSDLKVAVKKDYSEIKICHEFEKKINMRLAYKENGWILISHNLPDRISLLKIGMPTTLKLAVENCKVVIENLQDFFEVMETIDRNCEVLEPIEISSKDNWRIITYLKDLYVKVELPNPMNIQDVNVTFIGKSERVLKFTELYNKHETEEENIYLRLNYLKFEQDDQEMDDGEKTACGICLDFYNNDKIPIIFCDNSLCSQAYHDICISKHLKVSNVKVLNVVVGECPYCKFKIQANFIKDDQEINANK